MPDPVLDKADMYRRLDAGEFGNTLEQFFTIRDWEASDEYRRTELWGVRHSKAAKFPGTRLNVPRDKVAECVRDGGFGADFNISPMVTTASRYALWEGDVCRRWDGPGLLCSGNVLPRPGSWRQHMQRPTLWEGSAAATLLRHVLNGNSHDDLMVLLDNYPDHVVELVATSECLGRVPHRNAVIWEVRKY